MGPNGELSDIQAGVLSMSRRYSAAFARPVFIMSALAILESGKEYTDDELRKLLRRQSVAAVPGLREISCAP